MKPKRLTKRSDRMFARRERDAQWALMERVEREGVVWMCPWDKYHKHGRRCACRFCDSKTFHPHEEGFKCASCGTIMEKVPDDRVYVFGLMGANELFAWTNSHKDWFKWGRWIEKRCAKSLRLTQAGREALKHRDLYDMEPIHGGMVEPGYIVVPWPAQVASGNAR